MRKHAINVTTKVRFGVPNDSHISSMWPAIPGIFGKGNWVDLKLEGDVSAAPFGDGCKKGI